MNASPLVELNHLGFSYREKPAVQGATLQFSKGKVYGLVGPNGSGKSTLVKLACGLLQPQSGSIHVEGKALTALKPQERARMMGYVPQQTAIDFEFTVRDIVMMGRAPWQGWLGTATHVDHEFVANAMLATEITELAERSVKTLSGGEMQRVAIARAIAQGTPLLYMDEPVSQLDIHHQLRVMRMVRKQAVECGQCVVTVLHDLNLAAQYCDEIIMMHRGLVAGRGTPQEVLNYANIETIYGIVCLVYDNPVTGKPMVIPVE